MVLNFDKKSYSEGLLLPTKLEKVNPGYLIGPLWLRPLLTAQFFTTCEIHGENNRNERNLYCLDCRGEALCSGCTGQHKDHHVVQIRRSSYHDVVRVSELQKVLDLNGVQTYIINSAKVVFLNARPQPRHAKGVTKTCEICDRSLLDTNRYCSLGCKLTGIRRHNDMTFHLQPKNEQHQSQQQQQQQQHPVVVDDDHRVPAAAVDSEAHESSMRLSDQDQDQDHHFVPAVPARSSVTSEDTASSGGVLGSNSNNSSSKRTRSSRKATKSSTSSPLRTDHTTRASQSKQSTKKIISKAAAAGAADLADDKDTPLSLTAVQDIMSLSVQKSLGTLKLGRSSPSPCVSMEEEEGLLSAGDGHHLVNPLHHLHHLPGSPSSSAAAELSPPTPPPTRTAKRRKGTPHRAPFGM